MARGVDRIGVSGLSRSAEIERHGKGNLAALADERGVTVHGWAYGDERPATGVKVLDDRGREIADVPIGIERPDVVERVGERPGALRSGFRVRLEPRRLGRSVIRFQVHFENGDPALLGSIELTPARGQEAAKAPLWTATNDDERDRVLFGREGWLFLQGDSNDALGQHTGRVGFAAEDKVALRELIARRREVVESIGSIWLTAVVPDKEMVYREFLPPEIVPVDRRPVHDYLEISADAGGAVLYLLDDLRGADGEVYLKTDTHWNHRGAFFAHRAICDELQRLGAPVEELDERSIVWVDVPCQGDLGRKLYPEVREGVDVRARLASPRGRLVLDNKVRNHGRVLICEREDRQAPTCLVFGESFAPTLLFFLKESFGRVVFVHTSMFVDEIVAAERPDVVLSLPIERFLIRVPDDRDALARLEATARSKGGTLPWSEEG